MKILIALSCLLFLAGCAVTEKKPAEVTRTVNIKPWLTREVQTSAVVEADPVGVEVPLFWNAYTEAGATAFRLRWTGTNNSTGVVELPIELVSHRLTGLVDGPPWNIALTVIGNRPESPPATLTFYNQVVDTVHAQHGTLDSFTDFGPVIARLTNGPPFYRLRIGREFR